MKIHVTLRVGERTRAFNLDGRIGWTMVQLANAGLAGVAAYERPAPRWSGYVHELRQMGIPISTTMVRHGGRYKGRHARYTLACDASVTVLEEGGAL